MVYTWRRAGAPHCPFRWWPSCVRRRKQPLNEVVPAAAPPLTVDREGGNRIYAGRRPPQPVICGRRERRSGRSLPTAKTQWTAPFCVPRPCAFGGSESAVCVDRDNQEGDEDARCCCRRRIRGRDGVECVHDTRVHSRSSPLSIRFSW